MHHVSMQGVLVPAGADSFMPLPLRPQHRQGSSDARHDEVLAPPSTIQPKTPWAVFTSSVYKLATLVLKSNHTHSILLRTLVPHVIPQTPWVLHFD